MDLVKVLDSLPDAVTLHDLDGKIIWANRTTFKMSGLDREEVIGKLPTVFTAKKDFAILLNTLKNLGKTLKKGDISNFETLNREGKSTSVHVSLMDDNSGNPKYVIAAARDITKLRLLQQRAGSGISENYSRN